MWELVPIDSLHLSSCVSSNRTFTFWSVVWEWVPIEPLHSSSSVSFNRTYTFWVEVWEWVPIEPLHSSSSVSSNRTFTFWAVVWEWVPIEPLHSSSSHRSPEHVLRSKKTYRGFVNGFCWENVWILIQVKLENLSQGNFWDIAIFFFCSFLTTSVSLSTWKWILTPEAKTKYFFRNSRWF